MAKKPTSQKKYVESNEQPIAEPVVAQAPVQSNDQAKAVQLESELSSYRNRVSNLEAQLLEANIKLTESQTKYNGCLANSQRQDVALNRAIETLAYIQNRNRNSSFLALPEDVVRKSTATLGFIRSQFPSL